MAFHCLRASAAPVVRAVTPTLAVLVRAEARGVPPMGSLGSVTAATAAKAASVATAETVQEALEGPRSASYSPGQLRWTPKRIRCSHLPAVALSARGARWVALRHSCPALTVRPGRPPRRTKPTSVDLAPIRCRCAAAPFLLEQGYEDVRGIQGWVSIAVGYGGGSIRADGQHGVAVEWARDRLADRGPGGCCTDVAGKHQIVRVGGGACDVPSDEQVAVRVAAQVRHGKECGDDRLMFAGRRGELPGPL